jgi:hypothetical protein
MHVHVHVHVHAHVQYRHIAAAGVLLSGNPIWSRFSALVRLHPEIIMPPSSFAPHTQTHMHTKTHTHTYTHTYTPTYPHSQTYRHTHSEGWAPTLIAEFRRTTFVFIYTATHTRIHLDRGWKGGGGGGSYFAGGHRDDQWRCGVGRATCWREVEDWVRDRVEARLAGLQIAMLIPECFMVVLRHSSKIRPKICQHISRDGPHPPPPPGDTASPIFA